MRSGNGQKASIFQATIEKKYKTILKEQIRKDDKFHPNTFSRTGLAVFAHYKNVKRDVLMFEGCYQKVLSAKVTGNPSHSDIIRAVTGLYNEMIAIADVYRAFDRSAGVPIGPKFNYVKVWEWMTEEQFLLDVRQSTQNLASVKEDVNVPLCAELEGFAKPVENVEQLDEVGKDKNIDSAGVKMEGENNSTNCVAKKNDSRPMGTKKAKLEARLIASLNE
ncbi:hypothetical protein BWQ96_08805 [Gracilariopsis chorda]|uniref:Uncharacterized protein n=1 Tax=Gracilariopsis chorda TaxID=448386 RepID=A0A2V3IK16_9FLOR|nr:hypothetical protein BWQ96_08805 [Gracilariopsis chorda]|eukprot:PXF41470.1 hypothetical protein BWQ96_08805 [Gracilariopsis chorda]